MAIATFVSLKQYFMRKKGQMQTDEVCALAYSIAHAQFEQLYHSRQPKDEQKPIRTEMLPDWFESYQRSLEEYMKPKNEVYDEERIQKLRERLSRYRK